MRYILTDIEGTTTSVNFVTNTLFPYFKQHVLDYTRKNLGEPAVVHTLKEVQRSVWKEESRLITSEEAVEKLIEWTDLDRKHFALKALQGMVWRQGYERHALAGHVYDDVVPALKNWMKDGVAVGIYSSGSVDAQKLLFRYSVFGDLTPYFSHYFDTAIGHKREYSSYLNIERIVNIPAADILFLSDTEAELDAAQVAGFSTMRLTRSGTSIGSRHFAVDDFSKIIFNKISS